jgi:hypothetical protein
MKTIADLKPFKNVLNLKPDYRAAADRAAERIQEDHRAGLLQDLRAANYTIIAVLMKQEGLSQTIRLLQYAIENHAAELLLPQNGNQTNEAAKYLKAVELLEEPYETIKKEYKL